MTVPTLTPQNRTDALLRAQEAREARSLLLSRVKAGQVTVGQVLDLSDAGDRTASRVPVLLLLRALPGIGPATSQHMLQRAKVAENRRVRGLGRLQREALLAELGRRGF